MKEKQKLSKRIDWFATIVPLVGVLFLGILFMIFPNKSAIVLQNIRNFLGNDLGIYYALIGLGTFFCTMYIAFSKFGKIKLGNMDKPQYSSYKWGAMIFTSTMAADILFYSLCEWALYANETQITNMGGIQKWASTYPLFHWGPIAWGFYIALAVAFGFMLHVRKRDKQKFSEACRPILGNKVDGFLGKVIDLIAIFALIAGTATTFSLATPLLSAALSHVFNIPNSITLTIMILLLIATVYTLTVWFGMKGVSKLATMCTYLFFALLIYFLVGGGEMRYILETGFSSIGNMIQNFIGISTWMDPLRENSFPQNWTIYYWAYWMVWCVATPFFIGLISKGRTEPTEVSTRFAKLSNPTSGSYTFDGKEIKLSWTEIKTPDAIDTNYLQDYFNKYYDTSASKYYEQRIAYNNTYIGKIGYNIYEKNADETLTYLGRTENTNYTVTNITGGNTTYVIKSAYSLFNSNMSDGLSIKTNANIDSNIEDIIKPNPNDNNNKNNNKSNNENELE